MHVEIRSNDLRLPRAQSVSLAGRIRASFARLAHRIARIVVRLAEASGARSAARECTVEIHLASGEVTVVKERQRRLGALMRRATERAWRAAVQAIARQRDAQRMLRLPAPTSST